MDEMAKSEKVKPEPEPEPEEEAEAAPSIISHQRTRSSPSQREFSQLKKSPELNFANLSGDKLRLAQELLVPRAATARREEGAKAGGGEGGSSGSFRRPKVNIDEIYIEMQGEREGELGVGSVKVRIMSKHVFFTADFCLKDITSKLFSLATSWCQIS